MKTSIVITVAATCVSILALITFLISTGRDATALIGALPAIVAALGTLYGVFTVNRKVEVVRAQTNGTLSALREENAALQAHNSALLTVVTPEQVSTLTGTINVE